MATPNFWIGGDNNPTTAASWSQGSVPGSGDIAIFSGSRSNADCVVGLSGGADGPDEFVVRDDYYGNIGGPGNYYTHVAVNTDKFVLRGRGNQFIVPNAASGYTVVDTAHGRVSLGSDNLQNLDVKSGLVEIPQNMGWQQGARITLWGDRANVTIEASTVIKYPVSIVVLGGTLTCKDELDSGSYYIANVFIGGGVMRQEGVIDTTVRVHIAGGIFEYVPNADPSGEAPHFYVNGVLDVRESDYAIPATSLIIGPYGEVRGSAIETLNAQVDIDLRQDYP